MTSLDDRLRQARLIDLSDYIHAGEGANGSSYNHRSDASIMLKLYNPGKLRQPLDELELARKVHAAGIATPEPGDLVTDGTRYGVVFRRLNGKISYARAVGEHPENLPRYAAEFAGMCRELHAIRVDPTLFPSVKDRYLSLLEENPFFTAYQKEKIAAFIRQAPDGDTAIHGDLQFGNALFVGDHRYFIDLGDFCYGHPYFDVGMVYMTCKLNEESFTREAFHMDNRTASAFWDAFAPVYFGPDADLAAIEKEIRIYAGLKTLIVERDTRRPMTELRAMLEGTIY